MRLNSLKFEKNHLHYWTGWNENVGEGTSVFLQHWALVRGEGSPAPQACIGTWKQPSSDKNMTFFLLRFRRKEQREGWDSWMFNSHPIPNFLHEVIISPNPKLLRSWGSCKINIPFVRLLIKPMTKVTNNTYFCFLQELSLSTSKFGYPFLTTLGVGWGGVPTPWTTFPPWTDFFRIF